VAPYCLAGRECLPTLARVLIREHAASQTLTRPKPFAICMRVCVLAYLYVYYCHFMSVCARRPSARVWIKWANVLGMWGLRGGGFWLLRVPERVSELVHMSVHLYRHIKAYDGK
jgi:hypothetical protein